MNNKVTMKHAILAKCHDCCAQYLDGRKDCENTKCPFYTWMPYRKMEPVTEWAKYNHRRVGLVEAEYHPMDDEQKAALVAKLRGGKGVDSIPCDSGENAGQREESDGTTTHEAV